MKSIWDNDINLNNKFKLLNKNISTQVCIIGGGITGISIGYELFKKNVDFVILEKDKVCSKTTNFSSAKITSQHGIIYHELAKKYGTNFAKQYLEANQHAIQNIKDIIDKENIKCDFKYEDSYVFTQNVSDVEVIKSEYKTLNEIRFNDVELLDGLDIGINVCCAIKFKNQASFNPVKYTLSLANIIYNKLDNIYNNVCVNGIKEKDNHYIVYTDKGTVTAQYIVFATHYPIKDIPGFYFLKMYQDTSYIIAIDIGDNSFGGMYINYEDPTISLRSLEQNNKTILLVGGDNIKTGFANTKDKYSKLEALAKKLYPDGNILCKWNTQDCITLDKVPYIGRFSKYMPNVLVATGFNKWGMTTSNIAANIITDIILNKSNPYEKIFRATRYKLAKNIKGVYYIANQTVQSMIINKLKIRKENIEAIPNGVGKIIKVNNKKVGVYKDLNGEVYTVNPYCSHLKCLLTFNNLDKTWDCPCHGSRFDIYGKVINSPASKELRIK
ncbi:MAG: FAD-dependent oxidoreductase [Clostridia bacterium]|nr:FAD-dependent oxidoreductase [Clostridia bacterium]